MLELINCDDLQRLRAGLIFLRLMSSFKNMYVLLLYELWFKPKMKSIVRLYK